MTELMDFLSRGWQDADNMETNRFSELFMRFGAPAVALSLVLAVTASVGMGKRPADDQINPRSQALVAEGVAFAGAQKFDDAISAFETALAVDPRNRSAFIHLAHVAQKQGLPGKAIRLYREALLLDPNDLSALSGQGAAMVQKGALTKAKENLARITRLCVSSCAEQLSLSAAIEKGEKTPTVITAEAIKPKPVVTGTTTP